MVVNDFNIVGIPFCPNKTDTPLLVNPNAPLSLAIFLESLQMIGRKLPQIVEGSGDVERNQLSTGANLKIRREFLGEPAMPDLFSFLAAKGKNHPWFPVLS